jgi:transcriptional regulator with XRE-family HTH domain
MSSLIALFIYDQYAGHVQAVFESLLYDADMAKTASRLKALREVAGISQRELARQIGERQSNIQFWETTGKIPRSDVLAPLAKALGVTVEEVLGQPKPKRAQPAGGRLGQVFEKVSRLPRRQQQKVIEMAEGFLSLHDAALNGANGH